MATKKDLNLEKIIPAPPKDLAKFCVEQGALDFDRLIFRCGWTNAKKGNKKPCFNIVCTSCGHKFKAERIKDKVYQPGCSCGWWSRPRDYQLYRGKHSGTIIQDGDEMQCPHCKRTLKLIHSSRPRLEFESYAYPLVISNVRGTIVAAGYRVDKVLQKDGTTIFHVNGYEAYVFAEGKSIRCAGHGVGMGSGIFFIPWTQRVKFRDYWGGANLLYMPDGVFDGTRFENCRLSEYLEESNGKLAIGYLNTFNKYPQVENLLTAGFGYLLDEKNSETGYDAYCINWREKSPRKMLGLTKRELEWARKNKLSSAELAGIRRLRRCDPLISAEVSLEFIRKYHNNLKLLTKAGGKIYRLENYLTKIVKKGQRANINDALIMWADYYDAGKSIGLNFRDDFVLFPPKLKAAHDQAIAARRYKEDEKLIAKFASRYKQLAPFTWEDAGLIVRPAENESQLITEGKRLGHCVATYAKKHCAGQSIFFIRKAAEPDAPYYTLQINIKTGAVLQNQGKGHISATQEINTFVEKWRKEVLLPALQGEKTNKKQDAA